MGSSDAAAPTTASPPAGTDLLPPATSTQHTNEPGRHDAHDSLPPTNNIINSPPHVTDAPPFWSRNRHNRSTSAVSYHSLDQTRPAAIRLEDHTEEGNDLSLGCWARSVSIDDYVVVSGATGIGAYVVWHCTVQTLKGGDLAIRKRYSEFDRLREDLVKTFPHAEPMIPELPRKSIVSRFRPKFLEQRRNGLSHFLNCVLLNPEFASSPMLKDFIFN